MNVSSAQATVVTVGAGVLVLGIVNAGVAGKAPSIRTVAGTALGTFGLSLVANGAPGLAAGLALLWGTTTLIVSGAPTLNAVRKITA